MIGVICAMEKEKEPFLKLMSDIHEEIVCEHLYQIGKINDKEICLTVSNIGKVASAIVCTQMMDHFNINLVINCGVAGGLKDEEELMDIVVCNRLTYHDWIEDTINGRKASFENNMYSFVCDPQYALKAKQIGEGKYNIIYGDGVSGDMFVTKNEVARIIESYPSAYMADMESGSIAQCCECYKVPYLIIRCLSDIVTKENNIDTYFEVVMAAAEKAAQFTALVIENL